VKEYESGDLSRDNSNFISPTFAAIKLSPDKNSKLTNLRRTEKRNLNTSQDSDFKSGGLGTGLNYDKLNYFIQTRKDGKGGGRSTMRLPTASSLSPRVANRVDLRNSDIVFFNEFLSILKRKEYTAYEVHKFFRKITNRFNK